MELSLSEYIKSPEEIGFEIHFLKTKAYFKVIEAFLVSLVDNLF